MTEKDLTPQPFIPTDVPLDDLLPSGLTRDQDAALRDAIRAAFNEIPGYFVGPAMKPLMEHLAPTVAAFFAADSRSEAPEDREEATAVAVASVDEDTEGLSVGTESGGAAGPIAYFDDVADRFLIHQGSLNDVLDNWHEGDEPLGSADYLVVFRGVSAEYLLVLTNWASDLIEEDLVATTDPARITHFYDGVADVQEHMRKRTGDATGTWDRVPEDPAVSSLGQAYDIELWHDTTMWNEGFEQACEPHVVLRVADGSIVTVIEDWVAQRNDNRGTPWDQQFKVRSHPSDPRIQLPVLDEAAALGAVGRAVRLWQGI